MDIGEIEKIKRHIAMGDLGSAMSGIRAMGSKELIQYYAVIADLIKKIIEEQKTEKSAYLLSKMAAAREKIEEKERHIIDSAKTSIHITKQALSESEKFFNDNLEVHGFVSHIIQNDHNMDPTQYIKAIQEKLSEKNIGEYLTAVETQLDVLNQSRQIMAMVAENVSKLAEHPDQKKESKACDQDCDTKGRDLQSIMSSIEEQQKLLQETKKALQVTKVIMLGYRVFQEIQERGTASEKMQGTCKSHGHKKGEIQEDAAAHSKEHGK